jgi:uncharacterized membrane protein SpoIIM required for sporulation
MKILLQNLMLVLVIVMTFGSLSQAQERNDSQLNKIVQEYQYDKNKLLDYYSDGTDTSQYEIFPNNHRYQFMFTALLYVIALISATILMKITT